MKKFQFRNISTSILQYREDKRTYYDILGIKEGCSQKEVKEAYINLSKIHHPDKSHSKAEDQEFKKILEAYNCLSKSHSRVNYDNELKGVHIVNHVSQDTMHRPFDREQPFSHVGDDYYGIKGVKKVANWKIVMACVIFCATGVCLQIIAISKSLTFKRDKLTEKSANYSKIHEETRLQATSNSNVENLERILVRMKNNGGGS